MDLKSISDLTVFSHRPQAGISIGVFVRGDFVHLAATFQNPLDVNFNRGTARQEVLKRLAAAAFGNGTTVANTRYIASRPLREFTSVPRSHPLREAKDVIALLRNGFKPDPDEVDTTFTGTANFGGVELRGPISREASWEIIKGLFLQ